MNDINKGSPRSAIEIVDAPSAQAERLLDPRRITHQEKKEILDKAVNYLAGFVVKGGLGMLTKTQAKKYLKAQKLLSDVQSSI